MNPTNYTGAPGYPGAGPGQQQQQQQPYTTTGEPTGDAEAGRGGLGAQGAGYQRKEGAEGGGKPGAGFGGGAAGAGSPAQGQMPYGMNQAYKVKPECVAQQRKNAPGEDIALSKQASRNRLVRRAES
ncbi:MAG: hypothetical protein WDW38_008500 [Sanguina aurantia]